jgi:hypothetical protein
MKLTPQRRNRFMSIQQGLCGYLSERTDDFGFDDFKLFPQKRNAGSDLVRLRRTICRRTTFYNIGDIDVFSLEFESLLNDIGEQASGFAHKRTPKAIFVRSGAFTYKCQPRTGVTFPKDQMSASFMQFATNTLAPLGLKFIKRDCIKGRLGLRRFVHHDLLYSWGNKELFHPHGLVQA